MNNIIWRDEKNRIILSDNQSLIIEEKFFSPMYQETIWLHIPNDRRAELLEKVLTNVILSLKKPA